MIELMRLGELVSSPPLLDARPLLLPTPRLRPSTSTRPLNPSTTSTLRFTPPHHAPPESVPKSIKSIATTETGTATAVAGEGLCAAGAWEGWEWE